jgi:hypothetical protein
VKPGSENRRNGRNDEREQQNSIYTSTLYRLKIIPSIRGFSGN